MGKFIRKYIFFQKDIWLFKRALKKRLAPRAEFFCQARTEFLAEFGGKKNILKEEKYLRSWRGHTWRFALLGTILVFLAGGGMMAMAYQPSVGPGHPLYSVKRVEESIQLAVASKSQEPFVHYQLAKNRLDEIKSLNDEMSRDKTLNGSKNLMAKSALSADSVRKKQEELKKLNREFDQQVDAALGKIDQIDDKANDQYVNLSDSDKKKEKGLCEDIASTLEERNSAASYQGTDYGEDFATWQNDCGRIVNVFSSSVAN